MAGARATCSRRGKRSEKRERERERERETLEKNGERPIERKVAMPTAAAVQGLRFLSPSLSLSLSPRVPSFSLVRLPVASLFVSYIHSIFCLSLPNPPLFFWSSEFRICIFCSSLIAVILFLPLETEHYRRITVNVQDLTGRIRIYVRVYLPGDVYSYGHTEKSRCT